MNGRRSPIVRLVQASANALLRGLPAGSVDLVITDPPYSSIDRHISKTAHLQDWFGKSLDWPTIGRVLQLARTRLKPSGVALVMVNQAGLQAALAALQAAGFETPVRVITWDRRWPGLGIGLRHQTEFILVGRLPSSRQMSGVDIVSAAAVGPNTSNRYPTEKPADLGRALASMAGVGRPDVVVDPFCGSGALLVGALERGATVIGSDISARAIARARERLGADAPTPTGGHAVASAHPAGARARARTRPAPAGPTHSPAPRRTGRTARETGRTRP